MGQENPQKGYGSSKPVYVIDEKSGKIIPVYLPADAVIPEAKPGVKSGNPLLDEINDNLREEGIIKKMKELYQRDRK